MIPRSTRFKCPQCKALKKRPGRCNLCGKLPMGREGLDEATCASISEKTKRQWGGKKETP
jgi:hypothetical protein